MCECGCTSNDERYTFDGPRKSFYILTIHGGCTSCCSPPGISIERINPGDWLYKTEHREDFIDGQLPFERWNDSEGVGIITGHHQHEFVEALAKHLVGTNPRELCDDDTGIIDQAGAEVLLEEMYHDAIVRPHFPAATV